MTPTTNNKHASTGVAGLDDVLGGGLPRGRFYLVHGDPGSGKTTMALQFLLEGIARDERCLYITLSETREELSGVAESHGWSLGGLSLVELSAFKDQLAPEALTTIVRPSEIDLSKTTERILAEVERARPQRIVFDSLSELRLLAQDPLLYRRQLLALKQRLLDLDATMLLLDDRAKAHEEHIHSVVHGVITLERSSTAYGTRRRHLHIDKLRGVPYRDGYHDYTIEHGGCVVYPQLVASDHGVAADTAALSSGIAELDAMLGGGIDRGSSLLLVGSAGTGKSSIGSCFIKAAAERGEISVLWMFEETRETYLRRSRSLGLDLQEYIDQGLLIIRAVDPADMSAGELSHRARADVEQLGARLVILDSLSGYLSAMPDEKHLQLHLHELLTYLNHRGVVTLLTLAQHGFIGPMQSADISYLADAVMLFRFFEAVGSVKKAISVIKKRTGGHEDTIREFSLAGGRIRIGEPLSGFQGVLTGNPVFTGKSREILGHQG